MVRPSVIDVITLSLAKKTHQNWRIDDNKYL